jgi:PAT family beta-lactamase induction signal transducer AmpG
MHINRYITSFFLGLNSGLVYALLVITLVGYLDSNNISLPVIGMLSLIMLPYSCKPIWSPFVDNFRIGLFRRNFGQRKEWILISQSILIVCLIVLGTIDLQLSLFFFIAFIIALMGATSDIALHGYRIELFKKGLMSKGSSFNVLGFRLGLFVSGSCGLYLAAFYSWPVVFLLIGACLIPGMIVIGLSKDSRVLRVDRARSGLLLWAKDNFVQSIITLFKQDKILYVILLLGFYKVSDGYLDAMFIPFSRQIGFSQADVANARAVGIFTGVIGNFIGVKIIERIGMRLCLLSAEAFAAITNLFFILLIYSGRSTSLYLSISGVESFFSGISNIVLLSYISSICSNKKFTASHFAILTSFSMILRTLLSGTSGWLAIQTGWAQFFIISSMLSVPAILCMYFLKIQDECPSEIDRLP